MTNFFWSKKIFFILFPITLLGQTQKNDLTRLTYDSLKKLYFDSAKNQSNQIQYANAYLAKANKENIPIRKAKGYYMFSLMNKENEAIRFLDSVIKFSKNTNDLNFPNAAYCEKADILKKLFKFKEALDNYLLAEKQSLKKGNMDDYFIVKYFIAKTKSEDLGEVDEALDMYRECYHYYKNKNIRDSKYFNSYYRILFALADSHKALHQTDSATFYNKLGYHQVKTAQEKGMLYYFILNEGANQVVKKKYNAALDSIYKALPKMIAFNDEANIMASYYYLGKAYAGLGKKHIAVQNFIKVDSLYNKTKMIYPELISGYPFLISYYKNKGDKEKQLQFLTTFMIIDSGLQKNYKQMNKLIIKEYEIPHLVKEKEVLIQSLKSDKTQSSWITGALLLLTIPIISFGFYQQKLKKTYRARFEKIINDSIATNDNQIFSLTEETGIKLNTPKTEDLNIAPELIDKILKKLKHYETEKGYLQPNITIQMLSQEFDTNTKYVSKIVNVYKNKTFIQYINDLRIEYAVINLQEDNKLRKYTIQALALEFGFNSAESFSAAFYKKTGIKPTFFIKELNET